MIRLMLVWVLVLGGLATVQVRAAETEDTDAAKVIALPAAIDGVFPAGAGRYLLLKMNRLSKLAVLDVTKDKITGYIPLASNESMVAGGLKKVVIIASDKGVAQRWNLDPLEKDLTVAVAQVGQLDQVVMGHASEGPVMLMTREGPKFLSLGTMKLLSLSSSGNGNWSPHPQYPLQVAASADGQTFCGWEPGLSPSGVRWMQIHGNQIVGRYEHDSAGQLYPSWDGSLVFTGNGLYTEELKSIAREPFRGSVLIPAYQSSYFAAISFGERDFGNRGARVIPKLSIYTTGDRDLLLTLDEVAGLSATGDDVGGFRSSTLGWHDRVFLEPQYGRLLVVGESRDRIYVTPFDIMKALEHAGIDYLFVDSLPPASTPVGKPLRYEIVVKSKKGGVKMSLDSGPEGMALKDGVLSWQVPADHALGPVGVIISVENAAGQSIFHTFNLQVGEVPAPKPAESASTPAPRPANSSTSRPATGPATN